MTAQHITSKTIYEGCRTYIASIIGVDRVTLWRWETKKKLKSEIYNGYEVVFKDVVREKQNKGKNLDNDRYIKN